MVEVSLTVGKLDASLALLLTKDHHLIEFPTILLPNGVKAGSIVKIKCEQDLEIEREEAENFQKVQDEILNTFGKSLPKSPVLKIKNITQTSCVLEWDNLDLGTANLKNLILFKDGKKLGSIPLPLTNRTTKLSGLSIDKTFTFQIKLDTTAGIYASELIEVTTHKMTDLSGITVCLGDLTANDPFTKQDIEDTLKNIGAKPSQDKIHVDTTHFICTRENKANPEYLKAQDMNIPIIRPEWLKACERERRIVGVTAFYLKECVLPDIFSKNYWGTANGKQEEKSVPEPPVETPTINEPEQEAQEVPQENANGSSATETVPQEPQETSGESEEKKDLQDIPIEEPVSKEIAGKVESESGVLEEASKQPEETKEEAKEETKEEPKEEAKEEPKEVVKEEPKEELKEVDLTEPIEEPKVEEPKETKTEEPKETKVEEPKVEEPKVEEPKVEEPIVEEPIVEEPIVEEPTVAAPVEEKETEVKETVAEPTAESSKEPVVESEKPEDPKESDPVEAELEEDDAEEDADDATEDATEVKSEQPAASKGKKKKGKKKGKK